MNHDKLLDKNLNSEAKNEMKKLSPKQLLIVGRTANKLIRSACPECAFKMRSSPAKFKNISSFCTGCQHKEDIIDCFKKLQKIYKKIK